MEELKRLINQKINSSHKEIIEGVLSKSIKTHNGLLSGKELGRCHCEYCIELYQYVSFKMFSRRHLEASCETTYYSDVEVNEIRSLVRVLLVEQADRGKREQIKIELKRLKDRTKELKKYA